MCPFYWSTALYLTCVCLWLKTCSQKHFVPLSSHFPLEGCLWAPGYAESWALANGMRKPRAWWGRGVSYGRVFGAPHGDSVLPLLWKETGGQALGQPWTPGEEHFNPCQPGGSPDEENCMCRCRQRHVLRDQWQQHSCLHGRMQEHRVGMRSRVMLTTPQTPWLQFSFVWLLRKISPC